MTVPDRDPITGEDGDGPREGLKTVLIDAGPLVGFTGASRIRLLNDLLDRMGLDRVVTWVVDDEVERQESKYPGIKRRWRAYADSPRVNILPKVTLGAGDPEVAAQLVELRSTPGAEWNSEDLGEYMTIATALVWRRRGYRVYVSIDDAEGAALAQARNLPNLRTEDLVVACIRAGLLETWQQVTRLWADLRKYSKLPALSETTLAAEWAKASAARAARRSR